jgi:hypothetical protein
MERLDIARSGSAMQHIKKIYHLKISKSEQLLTIATDDGGMMALIE